LLSAPRGPIKTRRRNPAGFCFYADKGLNAKTQSTQRAQRIEGGSFAFFASLRLTFGVFIEARQDNTGRFSR
jgi:hypothetical protein